MTRRTFLRVLSSGIAATAVVQALPTFPVLPPVVTSAVDTRGAITYEMLRTAYLEARVGAEYPRYMIVSVRTARSLGLIYDVDIED